jgi:hypothetical protein
MADEGETALLAAGTEIYQRGKYLVRPAVVELPAADGRKTLAGVLSPISNASMRDELAQVAHWKKWSERARNYVPTDPPEDVAEVLLSRFGRWQLPYARGVISTPALHYDGSLITKPGLDEPTGFYLALAPNFHLPPISERPSKSEAEAALKLLEDLFSEFPFVDDGGVSHSVALSGLMTPIMRSAASVVPMHAFTSPTIGTGKSFLVDLCSTTATDRLCPVVYRGRSVEELDKKLNGLLLGGVPLVSVDNVRDPLDSDLLCQACERPLLELRALGKSDTFTTPNGVCMFSTGTNLALAGEMIRRVLLGGLDAKVERPEKRKFKCDPIAAVQKDRGKYVAAILTIILAYLAAGRPAERAPLGSYGTWCRMVREPLIWLGKADPVLSQETVRENDPVLAAIEAVMAGWEREIGLVPKTALAVATLAKEDPARLKGETPQEWKARCDARREFHEALLAISGMRGDIDTNRLGNWLSAQKGRIVNGHRFVSITTSKPARWELVPSSFGAEKNWSREKA